MMSHAILLKHRSNAYSHKQGEESMRGENSIVMVHVARNKFGVGAL